MTVPESRPVRFPEAIALEAVFAERAYLAAYPVLVAAVGIGYAVLLQTLLLGGFDWAYLRYLSLPTGLLVAGMAVLLPMIILLNFYLWRHPQCARAPGNGSGAALSPALATLPSMICCGPLLPSLLALFVSGTTLSTSVPQLQYWIGALEPYLYAGALLLLWGSLRMAARRYRTCERPSEGRVGAVSPDRNGHPP